MENKVLIIVSRGFGSISGPSITLFHLIRGLSKKFDTIYVLNTISSNRYIYDTKLFKYLPPNVKIINFQFNLKPNTLTFLASSFRSEIAKNFRKYIQKIHKNNNHLFMLLASDIVNLCILSMAFREARFYIGYNVFFNFAPLDNFLHMKINRRNFFEAREKTLKILFSSMYKYLDQKMLRFVGHILAHTQYQANLYNRYLKIPFSDISIIPHMIDVSFVRSVCSFRRKSSLNKKLLLYCGGTSAEKGAFLLLRALRKTLSNKQLNTLKIIYIGTPQCKEYKELKQHIVIVKQRPYIEFLKLLSSVDAVIVPSLLETFGFVILEALSLGKPVIASNVGGIPEILGKDYKLLAKPQDEEDLARCINAFLENELDLNEYYLISIAKRFDISSLAPLLYSDILEFGRFSVK